MPSQPKLDAKWFARALSDEQRGAILDAAANSSGSNAAVLKVKEEKIERLWGNEGQARVR